MPPVTRKNDSTPPPATPTEGARSLFAEAGREGARAAQRNVVLAALKASGWNVTRAAEVLGMRRSALSGVMRELIPTELKAAQDAGLLLKGRPNDPDE